MLKKRKAQGLPITVIVVAVIALLVVVILVAVFSGRMGTFGKNIDALKSGTCEGVCSAIGKSTITSLVACGAAPCCGDTTNERVMGDDTKFSDVPTGKVCCCY